MKIIEINPINKCNQTIFKAGVKISAAENRECLFLYNKVSRIVEENKIPAAYSTDFIKLPSVTKKILDELNNLKIKYKDEN